jgi:hypothetical protein
MTANDPHSSNPVTVDENDETGSIGASDPSSELGVSRGEQEVTSTGVGELTVASDGSVSASSDSGDVDIELHFDEDGTPITVTLYSGAATPGGTVTFTPAQIAAAEAAAIAAQANPASSGTTPVHGVAVYASGVGTLRIGARATVSSSGVARIPLVCSGAKGTTCAGKLVLTVKVKTKVTRKVKGHLKVLTRIKVLTLGSASYSLSGGTSETLNLNLAKPGVALLDTAPQRRLRVQASTRPTAKRAATQTVELIGSRSIKTKKIP